MEKLQERLSRLLGCKVDVVTEPVRKERLKAAIDRYRALVFYQIPRRLQNIIDNAHSIFRYTEGINVIDFEEDRLVYDAVERCLERICESLVKLGEEAPVLMPD